VECLDSTQCQSGYYCINDKCSASGCTADNQCSSGYYCHPALHSCEKLPAGSCSADSECSSFPFGTGKCDPYTRKCGNQCLMGVLCLTGGVVCDTELGLCYDCLDDGDCQGVPCSQFDRTCKKCARNADCLTDGWVCDATSGSCYECLQNGDCPSGKICDTTKKSCVECKIDADCKNPSKPICGKSQTCLPQCSDKCVKDSKKCDSSDVEQPISYFVCGDYNDDPCLEWSSLTYSCGGAQTCKNDQCVCDNKCAANATKCVSDDPYYVDKCVKDSYGCYDWSTTYCPSNMICSYSSQKCVCEVSCSQMDKRCISGDPNHFEVCQPDTNSGCMYWAYRSCAQGTTCSGTNVCPY